MNRPAEYLDNAATAQSRAVEPEGDARQGEGMSEIRESIRQTREDMTETIDELHERLSPSQVTQKVKEQVKEQYRQVRNTLRVATIGKVEDMAERIGDTVYATRRSIVETVSANPIPSALVGVGVAWLWMNRRRDHGGNGGRRANRENWRQFEGAAGDSEEERGSALSSVVDKVGETAGNLTDRAKETVSGLISQTNERVGYVSSQAQYQARRVEESVSAAIQQSPLAVGAVALAVGTAIGLAIPQTRKENEWMGEARDTLVDKAQSVASEAIDKAQNVAEKVSNEISSASNVDAHSRQGT